MGSVTSAPSPAGARWGLGRRIAFRLAFVYLLVYCLPFPLDLLPGSDTLTEKYEVLWQDLVYQVAARFDVDVPMLPNGSGDTTFNYVQLLIQAVITVAVTLVWSVLDRRRPGYVTLHAGLRVYVRYMLFAAMLSYGLAKVLKTQFLFPSLERLTQPLGEMSPMGLVWTFMGYSPGYNLFTGGAEVLGAVLLCFRRTTTLGALVVVAVMSNVAALNYFYDVPVKLLSTHLLLMAGFLLLPDLRRLADFLVLNRAVAPVVLRTPFSTRQVEWGSRAVKVLFLGWCAFSMTREKLQERAEYGDSAPRPPLYGIYTVQSFVWDGQELPPLITDPVRWREITFGPARGARIRMMDDSRQNFRAMVRPEERALVLTRMDRADVPKLLEYEQPDANSLILQGTVGEHTLHVVLEKVDESKYLLLHRRFHWINEVPLNR
ncbi:hypothetical protein HPC49_18765 [Pyxidicoccus fallax]|uniref:DoxX family protein n=1 Tax=Pyxidicoccus fallax TaxID=394095 RepID=A0A848LPD2_9BACT|nr:hypothetical protein [Pyxidicoccus fallax]NMO19551.1 hypothetical protein [Pyxidicoccus fallax]NPC80254.1 hypothetical protein [Pyxidicoccus fallax]